MPHQYLERKPRPLTLTSRGLSPTAPTANDRPHCITQYKQRSTKSTTSLDLEPKSSDVLSSTIRLLHVTHSNDRRSILSQSRGSPFSTTSVYTTSGPHHVFYPVRTGSSLSRVKRPEREADHPPPSSVEVNV